MSQDTRVSSIAATLRAERRRRDLSQRELAKRTGTTQTQISRLENGHDAYVSTLLDIAALLDLELMLVPRRLRSSVKALLEPEQATTSTSEFFIPDEQDDEAAADS